MYKILYKTLNLFYFSNFPVELAMIMDRLYGGVCYAGIDTDPELKYPKVSFDIFYPIFNIINTLLLFLGCWARCVLQPAKLYRRHFGPIRAATTRRH